MPATAGRVRAGPGASLRRRAIILVLDGVGIGPAPDGSAYGDAGAATLPHVARAAGGLSLPNLEGYGLGGLAAIKGVPPVAAPLASTGTMRERSRGKDSTSGHWELAGLPLPQPLPTYPGGFPREVIAAIERRIGRKVLGNVAASGTEIIARLGDEHLRTGRPILYTSADSVLQLAAHERIVPVDQLYAWCRAAREVMQGKHGVGRVIARPFTGESGRYARTPRRHDFSLAPPGPTLLDACAAAGAEVIAIGKVGDLFAGRGIARSLPTTDNADGLRVLLEVLGSSRRGASGAAGPLLIFATLVDFDTLYGHRNDAAGFARCLAEFDAALPGLDRALGREDLLIITADHGNDPTTPGTDHTRERVPLLARTPELASGAALGQRDSFADVAASAAEWLEVSWTGVGESFVPPIRAAISPGAGA